MDKVVEVRQVRQVRYIRETVLFVQGMTEANIHEVSVGKVLIVVYSCKVLEGVDSFSAMAVYDDISYGRRGNSVPLPIRDDRTLVARKVRPPI